MSPEPQAPAWNVVVCGQARFTLLTERLLRLEYAADGGFEDRPSLAVVNRHFPRVPRTTKGGPGALTLSTRALTLHYRDTGDGFTQANLRLAFPHAGRTVSWRPGQRDRRNLKGTARTLDGVAGGQVPLGDGLLSRSGWALVDDSATPVLDAARGRPWVALRRPGHRQDLYFFAYGHDYKTAIGDGARLFGTQPLPPRYAFGYWWSRYWSYTDKELEALVAASDQHQVPLDVLVVDMDWHREGWTGYTWDRRLFPDPDDFLRWVKAHDLKLTLNLHPADGVGRHEDAFPAMAEALRLDPAATARVPFDCTDPAYMDAYFRVLHHPQEDRGVDFWWLDWQQGSASKLPGLDPLPWLNYLHWNDLEQRHPAQRPLLLSRFGGLGAGRYPLGFSGDTHSTWPSLAFQPYFTATAANVLFGYWSHDIGGHQPGAIAPELYTRWVQYGAFAPVLRTHTTKNPKAERRFWEYPAPYAGLLRDAVRRRYELVPYLYTEARRTYDTGISLCRPMYYDYPDAPAAYRAKGQYMLGEELLVAPVVKPLDPDTGTATVQVWLPPGEWFDTARGELLRGDRVLRREYLLAEVPVFVRAGAVLPGQRAPLRLRPGSYPELLVTIYPGDAGGGELYEDDGLSQGYRADACAWIGCTQRSLPGSRTITVRKTQGEFPGFLVERALEVRLPASTPPQHVKAGDESLPWAYRLGDHGWTYDGDTATTIVRVRAFDVVAGIRLTLDSDPALPAHAANGLQGLFARLAQVPYLETPWSLDRLTDPRRRLPVDLAQTGNRIARQPQTFRAEIGRIRGLVREAPAVFRWLQRHVGQEPAARVEIRRRLTRLKEIRALLTDLRRGGASLL